MIDFIDKLMKCMEYEYVFVIDFFKFDLQRYLLFYMRMNDLFCRMVGYRYGMLIKNSKFLFVFQMVNIFSYVFFVLLNYSQCMCDF